MITRRTFLYPKVSVSYPALLPWGVLGVTVPADRDHQQQIQNIVDDIQEQCESLYGEGTNTPKGKLGHA